MLSEHFARKNPLFFLLQWLLLALVIAVFVGSASALFLFSLDWATATRLHHHWLIWLWQIIAGLRHPLCRRTTPLR